MRCRVSDCGALYILGRESEKFGGGNDGGMPKGGRIVGRQLASPWEKAGRVEMQ